MKRTISNIVLASTVVALAFSFFAINTYADENSDEVTAELSAPKTSLTLMPVSRTLQLSSSSVYDGSLTVTNDGDENMKVEVYAAPYSYVYSQEEDLYKLGFNTENSFTQISRWITIKDTEGNYVAKPGFTIAGKGTLNIDYKITTPESIPAGGQYAVIFVQTVSDNVSSDGIHTEASAGMVIYGRSTEGETIIAPKISDLSIGQGKNTGESQTGSTHNFYGTAKVKNEGNVDFFAKGVLKVEPIIGFSSYETASNGGSVSVIPESERIVEDEWKETPDFGIYKVTWTVTAGEETESTDRVLVLISPIVIVITILVLTFIIIVLIIVVRKRKARRSRLAV